MKGATKEECRREEDIDAVRSCGKRESEKAMATSSSLCRCNLWQLVTIGRYTEPKMGINLARCFRFSSLCSPPPSQSNPRTPPPTSHRPQAKSHLTCSQRACRMPHSQSSSLAPHSPTTALMLLAQP